jgi:gamma-glutamyltranspeptidase / glutathione hydrolase
MARRYRFTICVFAIVIASVRLQADPLADQRLVEPEAATGQTAKPSTSARKYMVVAANPYAAEAGHEILKAGGSAVDAAIAVQMVLTLVEPQSSGIGGGAFLLAYDAKTKALESFDGRETAPQAARPDRFLLPDGKVRPFGQIVSQPMSVGVPGVVRALELAHQRHGRLPWSRLFERAIALAENGFNVSPRLSRLLAFQGAAYFNTAARDHFFDRSGAPWPPGTLLANPALAETLRAISEHGAGALHDGPIADAIIATLDAAAGSSPNDMTATDLADYRPRMRDPVCSPYRSYRVCSVGAPSAGGVTMGQVFGMLDGAPKAVVSAGAEAGQILSEARDQIAILAEAEKLAYADRDRYIADPDFVPQPALLDRAYVLGRARLIDPTRPIGKALPGLPPLKSSLLFGEDATVEQTGTSHVSILDGDGNAVSLTSSIQTAFGSGLMSGGFLLNSQLTDFSFKPVDETGTPIANRVEGGKRPRSSMAPTIIFDPDGRLFAIVGSPGGNRIILYNLKAIICLIDWQCSAERAAGLPGFGSRNGALEVEQGTTAETILAPALAAAGSTVTPVDMTSGLAIIERTGETWQGAADPRREGVAAGE